MRWEEIYDDWNYHQLPNRYLYHTFYSLQTVVLILLPPNNMLYPHKISINDNKNRLSKVSLYVFNSFHYYKLTSRYLCLKLELPIISKFPSHKVGIIKTQIISISNLKELNTMRRTSEWVKDKSQGMLRALNTLTRCLLRLLERARNWQQTVLCLWTCGQGSLYVLSIVCFIRDRRLHVICYHQYRLFILLYKISSTLLILHNASFPLLLCCFQLALQCLESKSGNALITGLTAGHTRKSTL